MRVFLILNAVLGLMLAGCGGGGANGNSESPVGAGEEPTAADLGTVIMGRADEVVSALEAKDIGRLASLVHPEKGVRFSPYAYVDVETDLTFTSEEVAGLLDDPETYTWGAFDGSGDPIEWTSAQYFHAFVYPHDYAEAEEVGFNEQLGNGNTINNISDVYPDGNYVEYHFSGFEEEYEGMDWQSLRLVFEEFEGTWYLVGIINDEWTI
ncbi:MAG: hypothetical protein IH851_08965 [Armatimonadetes bacterium]|nr:hypothetical protein [Armatimonadota bacterium]